MTPLQLVLSTALGAMGIAWLMLVLGDWKQVTFAVLVLEALLVLWALILDWSDRNPPE